VNFFESVFLLIVLLLIGFVLPGFLWRDQFIVKSIITEFIIVGSALGRLRLLYNPEFREVFVSGQWTWWGWTFLIAFLLSFLFGHVNWLRRLIESLAERFIVFLYLFTPITGVALFIILGRLLF
jgi:hypothetical protein